MIDLEQEAYIRNALEILANTRSYAVEVLTGPADEYIKDNFMDFLVSAELNLRKALI